jgi:hypothetical protein
VVHGAPAQPAGLKTRSVEAGYLASLLAGRRGRTTNSPPQLGQIPWSLVVAQSLQNVHSKLQIVASVEPGGRSLLQHSQLGRSSSMLLSPIVKSNQGGRERLAACAFADAFSAI